LYGTRAGGNDWYEINYQDIMIGSNLAIKTPTEKQKYGMYQLLVAMLENDEASNTPNNSNNEQE
jgi:hypothetical protein